jgi:hydrogenase nickel incorporation protein HypA/HybF
MHELTITRSIVDICTAHAGGRRVLSVVVDVGSLSGVAPEAVEFCFDVCTEETLLEGARLVINRIPGRGRCRRCNCLSSLSSYHDPCTTCGAYGLIPVQGQELRVREMEVE